jgi:hypothetical protein
MPDAIGLGLLALVLGCSVHFSDREPRIRRTLLPGFIVPATTACPQSRSLHLEVLALRHQLHVLQRTVPHCPKCQADTVRPLTFEWVADGVQYWSCACGLVWATTDGKELRSIVADRNPRKSA